MHLRASPVHPLASQPLGQLPLPMPLLLEPTLCLHGHPRGAPGRKVWREKIVRCSISLGCFWRSQNSASLTIWMASASSIILQCCLHGQQKPSFSRGQLHTLSSQTQVVHTGDTGALIRGDHTPAFPPMSAWQFAEQPQMKGWSHSRGCAAQGWTASATHGSTQIKATLSVVLCGATSFMPHWSGRRDGYFRGFIRQKEGSAFLSFNWQLQLEESYCCRISNVSLPF